MSQLAHRDQGVTSQLPRGLTPNKSHPGVGRCPSLACGHIFTKLVHDQAAQPRRGFIWASQSLGPGLTAGHAPKPTTHPLPSTPPI